MALKLNYFIYLFLAVLGLRRWQAFSSCREWGLPFVLVLGLLTVVASHCGAQALGRGFSNGGFSHCRLWALEHRLSSCAAGGIFPDQGFNPWFLSTVPPGQSRDSFF